MRRFPVFAASFTFALALGALWWGLVVAPQDAERRAVLACAGDLHPDSLRGCAPR